MNKHQLRSCIRIQKRSMSPEEISRRSRLLCGLVLETEHYRQSNTIYGYLPFNQEVDLTFLLQRALDEGKQVALPKCYGRDMRFILVQDLSNIQHSPFGVPEPTADGPVAADEPGLVIVPGLLFDRQGYRIGYGGGYYDRFLSQVPKHPTIGLCYDFQLVDQLEPDAHDIPVDIVFSI